MTDAEHPHIALVRRYLSALEQDASNEQLVSFFTPAVEQRELPNRLTPSGATRDLAALLQAAERGRKVVYEQRYAVRSILVSGDTVAAEVDWSARLRIAIGTLAAGDTMRASLAMFLTLRDGKISSQRNYDCFAPF